MKSHTLLLILVVLLPISASAGGIYGTIKMGGVPFTRAGSVVYILHDSLSVYTLDDTTNFNVRFRTRGSTAIFRTNGDTVITETRGDTAFYKIAVTAEVDSLGNYSMYVAFKGRCRLFLRINTLNSNMEDVVLYRRSVRYNWIIERDIDGGGSVIGYRLRRE